MDNIIDCEIYRRFGVEIEVNTPSGEIKKLGKKEAPEGAQYLANIINKTTNTRVEVHGWHQTHNNNKWVVKPDSSCGVEICTPIMKGWYDLKSLVQVIDNLGDKIDADTRCSLHVHVNLEDLSEEDIGKILAYWVKCEAVFIDSVPDRRKKNRYCQYIGVSSLFDLHEYTDPKTLLILLSDNKYYTINTFHLGNRDRKTMEFRLLENTGCLDPFMTKNWVRLVLHFVETAINSDFPGDFEKGNPWTSLMWLDPHDVFKFLQFDQPKLLSDGMKQVRNWFLQRLVDNCKSELSGPYSDNMRTVAHKEIRELARTLQPCGESLEEQLYSDKYSK